MDYSQLLDDDILEKIVRDHLPTFCDRYNFSLVSKSWNSLVFRDRDRSCNRRRLPGLLSRQAAAASPGEYQFLPFSMMGSPSHGRDACPSCGYEPPGTEPLQSNANDHAGRRPAEMLPRVTLPFVHDTARRSYSPDETNAEHIVGCLDGWLLIAEPRQNRGQEIRLHLFNPITRATIALPPRPPTLPKLLSSREDIRKAIISSSPDNVHVDCHVFVIFCSSQPKLAWCKVLGKGRGWKVSKDDEMFETGDTLRNVSYYGETLYALDYWYVYVIRDLIVTSRHRKPSVRRVSLSSLCDRLYEAYFQFAPDLAGQLLIISKYGKSVNKLVVSSSGDYEWEKVKSLDGYALFLGTHQSFSLPASDDHNNRVVANRIYYLYTVVNLEYGCSARYSDPYGLTNYNSFWFLPMLRDVIGGTNVCDGNRFQALLSIEDD